MDNVTGMPDEWESQVIDYTLGVLEPAEAARFGASLEECRKHVLFARQYEEVVGLLGAAAPLEEPPTGHKTRLMARITSTPQAAPTAAGANLVTAPAEITPPTLRAFPPQPTVTVAPASTGAEEKPAQLTDMAAYRERRRSSQLLAAISAVAAAIVLLVGLWGWNAQSGKERAEQQMAQLQAQQNTQAQRISDLEQQLASVASRPNIPPGYKTLDLAPQPAYASVKAFVVYNPDRNDAIFVASGLQQLSADKVYELWLLKPQGNPDKGGTFTADSSGSATHATQSTQTLAQYAGFAVTIEPAPGVDLATGPAVVVGKYNNQ